MKPDVFDISWPWLVSELLEKCLDPISDAKGKVGWVQCLGKLTDSKAGVGQSR